MFHGPEINNSTANNCSIESTGFINITLKPETN